jgi:hypothetical protein
VTNCEPTGLYKTTGGEDSWMIVWVILEKIKKF